MKTTLNRLTPAVYVLLSLTFAGFTAKAQTVNVQFAQSNSTNYNGEGPDANGTFWNEETISTSPLSGSSPIDFFSPDASTLEPLTLSLSGTGNPGFGVYYNNDPDTINEFNALTEGYISIPSGSSVTLTLGGLSDSDTYSLYLVGTNSNYAGDSINFTTPSAPGTTVSLDNELLPTNSFSFIEGNNYGVFTDLTAVDGSITVTATTPGGEGAFNGFQLVDQGAAPEPSTYALLGAGLLGLIALVRFRARSTQF